MDDFDFKLVGGPDKPFLGYVSSLDKTIAPAQALVRGSKNVYKKISGTIANRFGLKRRGAADDTLAGIKSSYEWPTSLGVTRVLRVANNKLQVESDVVNSGSYVWYDLLITSTLVNPAATLTRFVFDTFWDTTEKKDRLIMVRGDANTLHWSGGIATVASGDATTITKLDTTKTWAQEGFATNTAGEKKITINNVEYTYTAGESTSVLTGVSPSAAGVVSGDVAVQSVIIEADSPASGFNADFIKTIGNRVHYGSYTSRFVYIADKANFKNFTVPTPRTAGSPELLTLDNTGRGITVRQGNAHITAGIQDWYEVSYSALTVGSVATEITKIDKKPTAVLSAAYAHEFIDTVGDDIIYLDQGQQLRKFGDLSNLFQPKFPSLSQQVQSELIEEDFTGGHIRAIGDYIYITAPNNGRHWLHQTRESIDAAGNVTSERLWQPPQIANVSRFAVISGVVYGHSNSNPQLYQVWDTAQWHDDSPADEPLQYDSIMRIAYRSDSNRFQLIDFDKVAYEGYMAQGSEVGSNVYLDYQGASGILSPVINSEDDPAIFFSGLSAPSLGDSSLGDNPLGDGLTPESNDQELLPKFRKITDVNATDVFEYDIEVYSSTADSRWEILCLGPNVRESSNVPTYLRN